MIRLRHILSACLSAALLPISAQNIYYTTTSIPLSVFKTVGWASMEAGWISADDLEGWQLRGYYNPWEKVTVVADMLRSGHRQGDSLTNFSMADAAVEFHQVFKNVSVCTTAGLGFGNAYNDNSVDFSRLSFMRSFGQLGFTMHKHAVFFGLAVRFTALKYLKGTIPLSLPPAELKRINRLGDGRWLNFSEYGLKGGVVFKPFVLGFQFFKIGAGGKEWGFGENGTVLSLEYGFNTRKKKMQPIL